VDEPDVIRFVREEMGGYSGEMWMRSGREIGGGYAKAGSPLNELETLNPPLPVLHIYAQPDDPGYLNAQQSFAAEHPWFHVQKLQAHGHFPTFEAPGPIASAIEAFVAS
jgi:pimeloyl-ACP methyl ester carboxylesterase